MDKLLYILVIVFCVTNTNSLYIEGANRIQHGFNATENKFPYMVSLQRLSLINTPTRGHKCGGVLVSYQHALTAASCTLELRSGQMLPINPNEYRVFGGSVLLTNDSSINHVRLLANTTAYPGYNATNDYYVNNIAILIFNGPFLSNTVAPLSVLNIGTAERVQCNITGWGLNNTHLQYGRVETVSEDSCARAHGLLLPNMICGTYPLNAGAGGWTAPFAGCPGDEGGPLICQESLAGLIIDTRGCPHIASHPPQWYIRVSSYSSWINNITSLPAPLPPPTTLGPPTLPPNTLPPNTLPPNTLPPNTLPPGPFPTVPTTPAPGAASTFQPGMAVLAVIAVVQIITATVMN